MATAVAATPVGSVPSPANPFDQRAWFFRVLVGETAGFVVPGLAWFVAWWVGLPPPGAVAVVVLGGAGEGAALGFAQWVTLREWRRGFSRGWIAATAVGAALAWTCGMTPSTAHDLGAPTWVSIALGITLAPVLLLSLPAAQWLVLRGYVERAWTWITWSTAAWLVALPPTFVGPALLPSNASVAAIAATWAASGLVMAAIVAGVTGYAMSRVLAATAPG